MLATPDTCASTPRIEILRERSSRQPYGNLVSDSISEDLDREMKIECSRAMMDWRGAATHCTSRMEASLSHRSRESLAIPNLVCHRAP